MSSRFGCSFLVSSRLVRVLLLRVELRVDSMRVESSRVVEHFLSLILSPDPIRLSASACLPTAHCTLYGKRAQTTRTCDCEYILYK